MNNILAVAKREFASFFQTPVGYVAVGMYALLSGLGFTFQLLSYARISQAPTENGYGTVPDFEEWMLSPFLVYCGLLVMFLAPLITMRLLADERHRGTIELLFTFPLRDRDIVFGKFIAGAAMVFVMMLPVSIDLAIVGSVAQIEPAVLVLGLLAAYLLGLSFISLGLFVSSITQNQVTSGFLTFGLCMILYVLGSVAQKMPKKNPVPETWPDSVRDLGGSIYDFFRGTATQLAMDEHAKQMAQGIFQPKDPVYYVLFCAFFLFLTFRALESRNWRA